MHHIEAHLHTLHSEYNNPKKKNFCQPDDKDGTLLVILKSNSFIQYIFMNMYMNSHYSNIFQQPYEKNNNTSMTV